MRTTTSLFVLLAALLPAAFAADTGTITGSVISSSTHAALQGAVVTIPSLKRSVLTDEIGQFTIPGVPAGTVEISVSYTGYTEARQPVSVGTGTSARTDIEMKSADTVLLEKFTVESVREGQAFALTQQRNALNIKNVTALDEWGVLPTQNVAELLTRLPGVTVAQQDEDGLMMSVSIGGQPGGNAGYTRVNVDGMATTGVGGDGRTATMHSFSASMYEQVEVIAGQTPDKRADALGGQLNLVTASPLAMAERRRIDFTGSARYYPSDSRRNDMLSHHNLRPDLSLAYREVFSVGKGRRNLGIGVNVGYQELANPFDFDVLFYNNALGWLQDYQRSSGYNDRFVLGLSARVDYKISPTTKISFRALYNGGGEPFFQYTHVNPFGSANLSVYDPTTNPNGSILPGYNDQRTEIRATTTTSGVAGVNVGAARLRMNMWKVSFTSKNPTGTIAMDHNWGRLKVDEAFRWSNTHFDSGAGRSREAGEIQMRTKDPLAFILDNSNPRGQVFTQTNAAALNIFDPASYTPFVVTAKNASTQPIDQTSLVFLKRDTVSNTNEVSANFNVSYLLPTEIPITIKFGGDTINRRVNTFLPNTRRWYGVVGSSLPLATGLVPLTEFERQNFANGQRLPAFDPAYVNNTLSNTALWTEDVNFTAVEHFRLTRIVEEGVDSGYIQGTVKLGRFSAVGGFRNEWVNTETFNYTARSAAQRTLIANEPDPGKRALRDFVPTSRDGSYNKFFPSLHLGYDILPNLKLRASYSKSYGRPRLQDLVATPTADDTLRRVTVGNPDLKPATSSNSDIRLDYSILRSGFLSVRYFKKDIHDYVGSSVRSGEVVADGPDNGFGGEYVGYELVRPINLGTTQSKGIEVDYRQQLDFLPSVLKGLALRANYTNVRTRAVFNGVSYGPGQVVGSAGQWYIPRSYNVGLTYVYGKFGASWNLNYTSQFPLAFATPGANTNIYRLPRYIQNAGISYQIRPEARLFLDVNNIEEQTIENYRFISTRHYQEYVTPRSIKAGITARF